MQIWPGRTIYIRNPAGPYRTQTGNDAKSDAQGPGCYRGPARRCYSAGIADRYFSSIYTAIFTHYKGELL